MIGWILLVAGCAFFLYYGYHLLVNRGGAARDASALQTQCHLCRNSFPINEMVARDKAAGFVNYFCSQCIENLYSDLRSSRPL